MTQPFSERPQCLTRPAQAGDRRVVERLVSQFHQSLQLPYVTKPKPLSRQVLGMIVLAIGTLLLLLTLHGFYSHALALTVLSLLTLKDYWQVSQSPTNFWVVECDGEVLGCAKLLRYKTHSEAYLVCVDAASQGQGYGSFLMQRLKEEATLPLYLASQPHRVKFYRQLGFVTVPSDTLPTPIRSRLGVDLYQAYGLVTMVFGRSITESDNQTANG
ncbi:GNAT family N-acetyltransferase [Phormidium sp. FACHB-592]|uniref:GNAT family N-acetyltransferase n=1 Tax=Stenomitos frigidus AS-A4 TaxID=2933935 RepID=A0ABV0KIK2_9CYAN|nr:GNAT family N-acetyltransferase [Phormidium sp. FACHB-592]MBD2075757.1 GNAT family N-acetyltransferase [Phormidium sp. FACHB-592]